MTGTRPKLSWSDLPGARVGVWGLGREGLANIRKLCAMGIEPILVDDRPQAVAISGMPVLGHRLRRARRAGEVRCGGQDAGHQPLPRRRWCDSRNAASRWPAAWACGCRKPTPPGCCITGTKGKSTTTAIAGHLLNGLGLPRLVGGNIGEPPCDPGRRAPGLGLLGHRGVQLPGHGPAVLPARRGRHLAAPRPPRLARRRAELLPRQAVRVLAAGRGPDRRQRRQRPAARAGVAARAAGGLGARRRRPGRLLDGAAGAARRPQPPQRADRPALPAGARRRRGVRRGGAAAPRPADSATWITGCR